MQLNRSPAPVCVESGLLARVLAPYKPACRYLKSAVVHGEPLPAAHAGLNGRRPEHALAWAEGEFEIPASCYIDDTGHFNSVEFNLCYNQLVYVLMAQCVASNYLAAFAGMTLSEYLQRQLPDVLIHDFHSVFRRPLTPRAFRGTVAIDEALDKRRFVFLKTSVAFEDGAGGHAEGHVALAIVNRLSAASLEVPASGVAARATAASGSAASGSGASGTATHESSAHESAAE
jgi:hypothetical protein